MDPRRNALGDERRGLRRNAFGNSSKEREEEEGDDQGRNRPGSGYLRMAWEPPNGGANDGIAPNLKGGTPLPKAPPQKSPLVLSEGQASHPFLTNAAWAAASRATGTRNEEQLT